ncbi:hypothetical protein MycrhDRAFT_1209 [Mycolicibacterium rhodesiae JS60]|nr:hypothetical protein MycrhDRAFT_1209 [Mycolicibacterium rhodesiae JS60]
MIDLLVTTPLTQRTTAEILATAAVSDSLGAGD